MSQLESQQPDWSPGLGDLQREMDRFFDHFQRGKRPRVVFSEQVWAPHVDVYEADGQAVVLVDLAGVDKDQIQVEVEHDHLTIQGERRPAHHRGDERTFYALEIPYGAFRRVIYLPFAVDSSRAEADYRDGMLEILLPRLDAQQPRKVSIRTSEPGGRLSGSVSQGDT